MPVAAGIILTLATACSTSGNAAATGGTAAKVPAASAVVTPANGAAKVKPDKGVTVKAASGVLTQVSVQADGDAVEGEMSADKKSWQTKWTLKPDTDYTVTATAKNQAGKTATTTSKFTTMKVKSPVRIIDVTPMSKETVGIGMPIIVKFNRTVTHKANVERALEVQSTSPVEGAWRWIDGQEVIFRTKKYWPAHSKVRLVAHMAGVHAASGAYGVQGKYDERAFSIGAAHVAHVNLKTHKNKVYVDGKLARTIPVSGGRGGHDSYGNDFRTTAGIHLTMGKSSVVMMTSPHIKKGQPGYYHEAVYDDVQISNSGEYLHKNPEAPQCLGHENCSHGCVRQQPAGAVWYYHLSNRGDVVDITGSSRDLDWQNGWGYWQLSWTDWQKESALKQPMTTTPLGGGSTSASPSSPAVASSPN